MNPYLEFPRERLIDEMRRRAEIIVSGEALDLLRVPRHVFFVETGYLMQALAKRLDGPSPVSSVPRESLRAG